MRLWILKAWEPLMWKNLITFFPSRRVFLPSPAQQLSVHLLQTHHSLGLGCRLSLLHPYYLPCPKSLLMNCLCSAYDMGPGGSPLCLLPGQVDRVSFLSSSALSQALTATSAWTINQQMPSRELGRLVSIYGMTVEGADLGLGDQRQPWAPATETGGSPVSAVNGRRCQSIIQGAVPCRARVPLHGEKHSHWHQRHRQRATFSAGTPEPLLTNKAEPCLHCFPASLIHLQQSLSSF